MLGSILALLVMTALHITVGEQAPKSFAIGSAVKVAKFCAVPLEVFYRTLRPLVLVLNNASNALVPLFGGTPASSHAQQASLEELRQLIGGLTEEGRLDEADAQLLRGVFTLDERRAGEVMTPRTRVTALREGQTAREALTATRDTSHSRPAGGSPPSRPGPGARALDNRTWDDQASPARRERARGERRVAADDLLSSCAS